MNVGALFKKTGRMGLIGLPMRALLRLWKYSLNYHGFNEVYKDKLRKSKASIVFSDYTSKRFGGRCQVIYHGSEPAIDCKSSNKIEARKNLSIPMGAKDERIVLSVGFTTEGKGWDILKRLSMPKGWKLVTNSSKGYFNKENIQLDLHETKNAIDLQRGYLSEKELSMLFCASDAVILPYRSTSSSGVMFDALAHGLPFVSTDLDFFKEFAAQGLGISVKRDASEFSRALDTLAGNYDRFAETVETFRKKIKWDAVASKHSDLYNRVLGISQINDEPQFGR
jgi:glycosyltransferase involved in cell wall biosynthesis